MYSVKTGYKLARELEERKKPENSSTLTSTELEQAHNRWKRVWKLPEFRED
ncbi:hypothetical protein Scep_019725 [Stephania cephalantha]|uniref:Uncharacterized protein n=1 Tax=Stephania cephalantha TaxID=152367 RepID=A0AAP0IB75_9MAGN